MACQKNIDFTSRKEAEEEKNNKMIDLSITAFQLLIVKFGHVPQDMKGAIATANISSLQTLLVNSFRFQKMTKCGHIFSNFLTKESEVI